MEVGDLIRPRRGLLYVIGPLGGGFLNPRPMGVVVAFAFSARSGRTALSAGDLRVVLRAGKVRLCNTAKSMSREEVLQDRLHSLPEIPIMTEASQRAGCSNPWLFGVEFPHMEVHVERVFCLLLPTPKPRTHERPWQLSEIIAAGDRQIDSGKSPSRRRIFPDDAIVRRYLMWEPTP